MKAIIEKRKNFKHIVGEEWKEVYGEYEEGSAKERIREITEEYESYINSLGHILDDQDKMNDIESVTNSQVGQYDFDVGDFTYYITIRK